MGNRADVIITLTEIWGTKRVVEFTWGEGEVLRKYKWSYPVSSTIYKERAQGRKLS